MIPLRDVIPSRTRPIVTVVLVVLNAIVILAGVAATPLLGAIDLLYLWLFGGTVEDRMAHGRFLVFYALCGGAAAAVHMAFARGAGVSVAGAAATAGVMGAYFVLFPQSRILVLMPVPFMIKVIEAPAYFFAALWVVLQLFAAREIPARMTGLGVGAALVFLFRRPERMRVDWWEA
jgi:membrane associated rhomboid family serine protease